jgi:hypothetical protein
MIPTRAALAIPAAVLVLSGCGAAAAHAPRTTTVSAMHLPAAARAIPATALLRPLKVIPARRRTSSRTSPTATVANESARDPYPDRQDRRQDGDRSRPRASVVTAGAGGAYWTANGAEYELTPAGTIHKLGLVPNGARAAS